MKPRIIENVEIKVELGRAYKSGNEIAVELGRIKYPEELNDLAVNSVIQLDTKIAVDYETNRAADVEPFDVLVNGKIAAKGAVMVENGIFCVKITEAADKENNTANLKAGDVIELDKKPADLRDVFANGNLVAKGEIVIIDEHWGVRIQEIVRVD
jgi:flagellar motor switch/type III secretory pathway protein FliN